MNHPYEQLADLVDGTLDEDDLAGVHAHLDGCASCRADLAHATAGREAVRSLPQVTPPADLHRNVVLTAAAVVVAIAIALPNVGGGGDEDRAGATAASVEAGAEAQDAAAGRQVEKRDENYDAKDLERLARNTGSAMAAQQPAPQTTALDTGAAQCVSRAFDEQPVGELARLIEATFEGRPAYIAVYLEGPGAGEPADTAVVWVAAKDDCTILSFASARI
jgi:anti-sigma factor RsiW